ncbi:MAG: hypothetical protein MUC50_20505 [Myxococcota bacterium]|jgi:hypothetical protein|nr:hypothetical protein [Myxococcota bacterium]
MAEYPVVLCLQDTTELNCHGQGIAGLGPLSYEAQRGMYLHPTYVVSPAREPLGVLDAWMWAREPKGPDGKRPGIKESVRLIARLGGFLGRKGDGEPGVKTIWLGLQRVMDFAAGI